MYIEGCILYPDIADQNIAIKAKRAAVGSTQ